MLIEPPKADHDRSEKNLKVEKDMKLPNASLVGSTICSSLGCGKSRRNLTEVLNFTNLLPQQCCLKLCPFFFFNFSFLVLIYIKLSLCQEEKEARRIRRILANRESARQTIRRRQVIYSLSLYIVGGLEFWFKLCALIMEQLRARCGGMSTHEGLALKILGLVSNILLVRSAWHGAYSHCFMVVMIYRLCVTS